MDIVIIIIYHVAQHEEEGNDDEASCTSLRLVINRIGGDGKEGEKME